MSGSLTEVADYTAQGRLTLRDELEQPTCVEEGNAGTLCDAPGGMPFAFNSRWRSPRTGLVNMRARWYSPKLGQFTSHDPLGYVDTQNLYAFAAFDPINSWDPYGLSSQDQAWNPDIEPVPLDDSEPTGGSPDTEGDRWLQELLRITQEVSLLANKAKHDASLALDLGVAAASTYNKNRPEGAPRVDMVGVVKSGTISLGVGLLGVEAALKVGQLRFRKPDGTFGKPRFVYLADEGVEGNSTGLTGVFATTIQVGSFTDASEPAIGNYEGAAIVFEGEVVQAKGAGVGAFLSLAFSEDGAWTTVSAGGGAAIGAGGEISAGFSVEGTNHLEGGTMVNVVESLSGFEPSGAGDD